jgi:hypothetical protein
MYYLIYILNIYNMSHITDNLFPITRSPNSLHVLRDSNDNNRILATGNPHGADVINAFANEGKARRKNAEEKMFKEEDLDDNNIDPKAFFQGGVADKKSAKRRRASRKTNKRRSSKKQKSRRNKKSKSKHTK